MLPLLHRAAARSSTRQIQSCIINIHDVRGAALACSTTVLARHATTARPAALRSQEQRTVRLHRTFCASSSRADQSDWLNTAGPAADAARLLVDTMAMMKKYEASGLSRGQSEALTRHVTELLLSQMTFNDFKYVPQVQLERILIEWKAEQKRMQQDVLVKQEVHVAVMGKDTERLQAQLDKFKADIKHEVDKLTANQKLDLNLERGRMRDEMQQVRDKVFSVQSALEKEINSVRTEIETSKSETLKWVVVTVGGLLGAGFAAIRLSLAV